MATALRAAIACAVVLAACSGPSAFSSATTVPAASRPAVIDPAALDPCTLLDDGELATVGGWTPAPGGHVRADSALGAGSACTVDLGEGQSLTAIVLPRAIGPDEGEAFIDTLPPDPDSELHGFGDVAWFGHCDACPAGTSASLTTAASPLEFTLALDATRPEASQRLILEALARAVVTRLGL